ncbi:MAG: hypothetical protein V4699_02715 [Patescibacteria group bacterium]
MVALKKIKKKIIIKSRRLNGSGSRLKKSNKKVTRRTVRRVTVLELKRSKKNPIIEPTSHRYWESKATFNPTALLHDGKVHIIYRAIGDSDNSVLGYAGSHDGFTISDNFSNPVYFHFIGRDKDKSLPSISYSSGGGWGGGCEDPRLTLIGDKAYMLYTAFDGWGSVRIALTFISLDDFIAKRWNWKEPVLISPPGEIHKNWVLFPEKIKGQYAILHSLSPKIMIDYLDSLDELDGDNFIYSVHQGSHLWGERDRMIRGVGPSPLKTKYGWLVLYHRMEKHDSHRYKLWAMILDMKDPTKILYNSSQPILEPDEWYENEGYKGGVVYSCGAVIKDGQLFVYYGGADKVSAVATANLDRFLEELVHSSSSKLKNNKIKK